MNNKVFKIKNYEGYFSDEQIISLIKQNKLTKDDSISTKELKTYIKIKDSIYQYYLKGEDKNDETI